MSAIEIERVNGDQFAGELGGDKRERYRWQDAQVRTHAQALLQTRAALRCERALVLNQLSRSSIRVLTRAKGGRSSMPMGRGQEGPSGVGPKTPTPGRMFSSFSFCFRHVQTGAPLSAADIQLFAL